MKIVKYVFLLIVLAIIAVTVFIATQEGKYDIKKESTIQVPKPVLFNYINDYRNWENIGILSDSDTTAVFSYSGASSGEGAVMKWKKSGMEGEITTARLVNNDSIIQKASIDGLKSEVFWAFEEVPGGNSRVTVRQKGELSFSDKAYALLQGGVEEKIEENIAKGLANLNSFLVEELKVFDVNVEGVVNKRGVFYLGHNATIQIADLNKKSAEIFQRLSAFMQTNKIATDGMPFILYKSYDKAKGITSLMFCIPIKEEIFTSPGSEFEGGKLIPYRGLKTSLKGDYSHLEKAWNTAKKHIADNALQENTTGQYVEVYTKGMKQSRRPSEWITDIYIPIGQPTVQPALENVPVSHIAPPLSVTPVRNPAQNNTAQPTNKPAQTNAKPATTTGTQRPTTNPQTTTP